MRKWPLLLAAAAVVVAGCGGSGSSSTGGGGNTGGTGRAAVNLPNNPALLQVAFLTGQGRAPGDPVAEIRRIAFDDTLPEPFESDDQYRVETILNPARFPGLEQFTYQTVNLNVRVPSVVDSRFFDTFTLEVNRLLIEDENGNAVSPGQQSPPVVIEEFPAHVRVFQGRHTILPVFLDSASLYWDDFTGVVFDRQLFEDVNLTLDDGVMLSFLSDYVAFDISSVADKPLMLTNIPATRVYFSGDGIALSTEAGGLRPFEVLGPISSIEGTWAPPTQITPDFGTYSLMTIDPRDLTQTAKITSLMGIFRPYNAVLRNLGSSEMITFPNSRESADQDMVIIARNASGQITDMYFGVVEFDTMTFSAFPIAQVDDGDASNEVSGTISNVVNVGGDDPDREYSGIRSGTYTVTNGSFPSGFASSGTFLVFRR